MLCFEGKIFLANITNGNHNKGSEDLTEKGIPMHHFHQKFEQEIIKRKIEGKR